MNKDVANSQNNFEPEDEEIVYETTIEQSTGERLTTFPVNIDISESTLQRLRSANFVDPLTKKFPSSPKEQRDAQQPAKPDEETV